MMIKKIKKGQGSITKDQLVKILKFVGLRNIISPHDFYEKLKKKKLKDNEVCLTFDDCLKSTYEVAYPVLNELKLKGFFFIPTVAFENKINLLEVYRYFRINYFENLNIFYKFFFSKLSTTKLKKFLDLKEKKIKKIKRIYKFYSLNDIKFRLVRNELLSVKKYDSIMLEMFKEKNFNAKSNLNKIFINKKEIREVHKNNNIIGLHSHTHPNLIQKLTIKNQKKSILLIKKKYLEF